MPKSITHGQVRRPTEANVLAVAVTTLDFPTVNKTATPPVGATAVLTLKDAPKTPFTVNEVIRYEDGNNNNTTDFTVTRVVGPAKYQLTKR